MIHSSVINPDFENKSQFYTMAVNGPYLSQWTNLGINTELQIYLYIPYPGCNNIQEYINTVL